MAQPSPSSQAADQALHRDLDTAIGRRIFWALLTPSSASAVFAFLTALFAFLTFRDKRAEDKAKREERDGVKTRLAILEQSQRQTDERLNRMEDTARAEQQRLQEENARQKEVIAEQRMTISSLTEQLQNLWAQLDSHPGGAPGVSGEKLAADPPTAIEENPPLAGNQWARDGLFANVMGYLF